MERSSYDTKKEPEMQADYASISSPYALCRAGVLDQYFIQEINGSWVLRIAKNFFWLPFFHDHAIIHEDHLSCTSLANPIS